MMRNLLRLGCPNLGPRARTYERSVRRQSQGAHTQGHTLRARLSRQKSPATPSFAAAQPCLLVSFTPYGTHCWAGACVRPAWAAPWDRTSEPHSWVISPSPSGIQDREPFPLPPNDQLFLL